MLKKASWVEWPMEDGKAPQVAGFIPFTIFHLPSFSAAF
jgi:hypothetical protein